MLKKWVNHITLKVSLNDINEELIGRIAKTMKKKPGNCNVKFAVYDTLDNILVEMPAPKIKVDSTEFIKNISDMPEIKFKIN